MGILCRLGAVGCWFLAIFCFVYLGSLSLSVCWLACSVLFFWHAVQWEKRSLLEVFK